MQISSFVYTASDITYLDMRKFCEHVGLPFAGL